MPPAPRTLLCVANFPSNTGYAWERLERQFAEVARHLEGHGIRTIVAYPALEGEPTSLADSPAVPRELDARLHDVASLVQTLALVRRENVRSVYFMDQPSWRMAHMALRLAGAEHIVVQDHNSGTRTEPTGVKQFVKWMASRLPGAMADTVVAGSDFVAERQAQVNLVPRERLVRIWNGIESRSVASGADERLRERFGVPAESPVVACVARAVEEKGVGHLLRAFDLVWKSWEAPGPGPRLIYVGDGPLMEELRSLCAELTSRDAIHFAGYVPNAIDKLEAADLFVIPSIWQDAFPYSVLEPMARGRPVIGTRVGGIPEQIEDGKRGLLVPPGDTRALAEAIESLLRNASFAESLGARAREWVENNLDPDRQLQKLLAVVERGFSLSCYHAPAPIGRRSDGRPSAGSVGIDGNGPVSARDGNGETRERQDTVDNRKGGSRWAG